MIRWLGGVSIPWWELHVFIRVFFLFIVQRQFCDLLCYTICLCFVYKRKQLQLGDFTELDTFCYYCTINVLKLHKQAHVVNSINYVLRFFSAYPFRPNPPTPVRFSLQSLRYSFVLIEISGIVIFCFIYFYFKICLLLQLFITHDKQS